MSNIVTVQIVGAPIACAEGVKDSWRDTANWVAQQLRQRFGDVVRLEYYDLFNPDCPALPADAHLPLVLVEGESSAVVAKSQCLQSASSWKVCSVYLCQYCLKGKADDNARVP